MDVLGPRPRDLVIPSQRDLRGRVRRLAGLVAAALVLLALLAFDLLPIETSPALDLGVGAVVVAVIGAAFGTLLLDSWRERIGIIRTLSVFFEGLPAGIIFLDEGGRVTYANPALRKMTGLSMTEAVGTSATTFVHPEDQARVARELSRRRVGEVSAYELRILRKDGQILRTVVNAIPFFDGERYDGSLAVVSDLTEVLETRSRANRYQELSSFALDAVTHDLSNRMQEVISRAAITGALMTADSAASKASLAKVAQSAERAAELIREVKQIAAAERANWPKRSLEIVALVDRAVTLAQVPAGLRVEAEVSPEAAAASVEASDLAPFVLSKLLEQAAEGARGKGAAPRIVLEATVEPGRAPVAVMRVRGFERSVSDADLTLMLAPLSASGDAGTPWRSGVKLSFAAAVAQAHGWGIRAARDKGQGVVFEVRIPVEAAPALETTVNPP